MKSPRRLRLRPVFLTLAAVAAIYLAWGRSAPPIDVPTPDAARDDDVLARAFRDRLSNIQVTGDGVVTAVLPDDRDGSRHQRFILRLASGQTLLIAHNIDVAPRVESVGSGDSIRFHGVYEWNSKGGIVHWTHHDPEGMHEDGWLEHGGRLFR